jgi:hypothetical protein
MAACIICGKEVNFYGSKTCSIECSNKNKSKIYHKLKEYKTFTEIPENVLKELKSYDRNRVLPQIEKNFDLNFYLEFREFWDNYRICKSCGDFFRRSTKGCRQTEHCEKEECQNLHKDIVKRASKIRKETLIERYGVDSYSKTAEFAESMKNKNPFYSKEKQKEIRKKLWESAGGYEEWKARQKVNSTKFQRSLTKAAKEKITKKREQTTLERHGVPNMFNKGFNISKSETKFLDEIESQYKIKLKRQQRFDNVGRVDGFDPAGNAIYEFLGDYWHGNPFMFKKEDLNLKSKKTFGELLEGTFSRFQQLKDQGYQIYYIWESDYKSQGISALKNF